MPRKGGKRGGGKKPGSGGKKAAAAKSLGKALMRKADKDKRARHHEDITRYKERGARQARVTWHVVVTFLLLLLPCGVHPPAPKQNWKCNCRLGAQQQFDICDRSHIIGTSHTHTHTYMHAPPLSHGLTLASPTG